MPENILQTKCTVLECIVLQTDIDTKDLGTKEEGKDSEFTHSEMAKLNLGTGRMAFLMFQAPRMQRVLLIIIVLKCLTRFRYRLTSLHLAFAIKLSFASTFSYCMEEGYVDFGDFCSL